MHSLPQPFAGDEYGGVETDIAVGADGAAERIRDRLAQCTTLRRRYRWPVRFARVRGFRLALLGVFGSGRCCPVNIGNSIRRLQGSTAVARSMPSGGQLCGAPVPAAQHGSGGRRRAFHALSSSMGRPRTWRRSRRKGPFLLDARRLDHLDEVALCASPRSAITPPSEL